jgi:hypothetical protein
MPQAFWTTRQFHPYTGLLHGWQYFSMDDKRSLRDMPEACCGRRGCGVLGRWWRGTFYGLPGIRYDPQTDVWEDSARAQGQRRRAQRRGRNGEMIRQSPTERHKDKYRMLFRIVSSVPNGEHVEELLRPRGRPIPLPATVRCPQCGWSNHVGMPPREMRHLPDSPPPA